MTARRPEVVPPLHVLKVVTFNTWKCDGDYAARVEAMSQQMMLLQADIYALQESFATVDGTTDTAVFFAKHRGNQIHPASSRRQRRWFQGAWGGSYTSLAMLTRFPLISAKVVELPSSTADGGRVAQLCAIETAERSVLLANTHLSHLPQAEGGALRTEQLRALLNEMARWPRPDLALVCGDFNASLDSDEFAPFMESPWGLMDAYAQAGGDEKFTCRTPKGNGLNLDHILCMPSCSNTLVDYLDASVVLNGSTSQGGVLPSDHAGVQVTFSLN
ncbi:MAG: endonuclease/exonuclease/phosphatase family protein [Rhodoferax sp.]